MSIISDNLQKYRLASGMTIRDLASKANLDESVIGKYEQDIFTPNVKTLTKLADAMNISLMALIMPKYQILQYLKRDYQLTGRDILLCQLILDMNDNEFAKYLNVSKTRAQLLKSGQLTVTVRQRSKILSILRYNAQQLPKLSDPVVITPQTIKLLRRTLNLTQPQLAETLGTIRETISSWERGIAKPNAKYTKQLLAIMDKAGVTKYAELKTVPPDMIKRLRTAKGWSQLDLAKKLGTTRQLVARWETGKTKPLNYAGRLHEALTSSDNDTILIASEIIENRKKHNFSQVDLAEAVGVWPETVENWENGKYRPSKHNNAKLKKIFAEIGDKKNDRIKR